MKILQKLNVFMVFGSLVFLMNCGSEDTVLADPPTLSVTATIVNGPSLSSGGEVTAGDSVNFLINISAPGGFSTLFISGSTNQALSNLDLSVEPAATQIDSYTYQVSTTTNDAGAIATYHFITSDLDEQKSDTVSFNFIIGFPLVDTYTSVILGGQNNANDGFYNAISNISYTYLNARDASLGSSSPVDLGYYWNGSNNNTLAGIDDLGLHTVYSAIAQPIDGAFTTKNSTTFVKTTMSVAGFDAIQENDELLDAALFQSGGTSNANSLSQNEIIAFRFDSDRGHDFGLIKILNVNDTNGSGTITITLKVPGQ